MTRKQTGKVKGINRVGSPARATLEKRLLPGVNPTIASYNASVVNFYNATDSLARFRKKIFSSTLKSAVGYYNAGVVAVN
jgi:hypothetical protein